MANDLEGVLIVGGGFTGINVAYHLAEKGIPSVIVEAGKIIEGSDEMLNGTKSIQEPYHSRIIGLEPESSLLELLRINGDLGAKLYLEMAIKGTEIIAGICKKLGNESIIEKSGGLFVGGSANFFKKEKEAYDSIGFKDFCYFYSKQKIIEEYCIDLGPGLFFPKDCIVDIKLYLVSLLEYLKLKHNSNFILMENKKVLSAQDIFKGVKVELCDNNGAREHLTVDNLVFATNGFYNDKNLKGLLKSYWSFMLSFENEGKDIPPIYVGIKQDFDYLMRKDNLLVIGGEEKKVTGKNFRFCPTEENSISKLEKKAIKIAPNLKKPIYSHFGVCASTKDQLMICGKFFEESRIAYLVGCNGICHHLAYGALLMPSLLGYLDMSDKEKTFADFVSPKRFTR